MVPRTKASLKVEAPVRFYRVIAFGFIALTGVLVIFAAYFLLGRVEINVKVLKEPISADFIVDLKESTLGAEAANSGTDAVVLSGKIIETAVDGSKEYATTGVKEAQGDVGGKVTIFNNYSKNQPLVATTRLMSKEGILYRLKNRVDVPAGGKVEAEVYADKATDEAGKLGPTRFTIPGLWEGLQDKIYAQSFESMHGGNHQIKFMTQTDLDNAYNDLTKTLSDQTAGNLKTQMAAGEEILSKVIIKNIDEKKSSLAVDGEGDKFNVNLKLKVVGVAFAKKDLEVLSLNQLKKVVPQDKELVSVDYGNLTFMVEKYDLRSREANMMVHLEGAMAMRADNPIFDPEKFIGLDKDKIFQYFSTYQEVERVTVKFSPPWIKTVPQMENSIKVIIKK